MQIVSRKDLNQVFLEQVKKILDMNTEKLQDLLKQKTF